MLALSGTMLVGCTQSEYIGEAPQQNGKIVFSGASGKMTRATSNTGTVAEKLDGQIKFYGVKNTNGTYSTVFNNYVLWSQGGETTSNPDGDWEYVGPETQKYGSDNETIGKAQYIKYWDYSASEYNFVAGSPVAAFKYNVEDNKIVSATVTGIAGHLNPRNTKITTNPIYIANPVKVEKGDKYDTPVTFDFVRQQSFVRVGVFETIPGYKITAINFYQYNAENKSWGASPYSEQNIILASASKDYFTGATNATATVTYKWDGTPSYTFKYTDESTMTQQNNWFGGKLSGVPATTSTEATVANLYGTDVDMASTGYFTVLPTNSATTADALLVKCDYTLTALDGAETIKVTGATAAIPAAYTKWAPNTSYTYLFKISDNTNGTTGVGGPEGLFPITFDAAVVEEKDGTAQGTVTTVSTPSITTYQEGFAAAMKYVTGKAIYVTAQNDMTGDLEVLTDKVEVFSLGETAKTEADLILTAPTTGVTPCVVGNTNATVGDVTFTANQYCMFTPTAAGYYAIQYMTKAAEGSTPASYAYKVVCVE